jgi:hypothetical protein
MLQPLFISSEALVMVSNIELWLIKCVGVRERVTIRSVATIHVWHIPPHPACEIVSSAQLPPREGVFMPLGLH